MAHTGPSSKPAAEHPSAAHNHPQLPADSLDRLPEQIWRPLTEHQLHGFAAELNELLNTDEWPRPYLSSFKLEHLRYTEIPTGPDPEHITGVFGVFRLTEDGGYPNQYLVVYRTEDTDPTHTAYCDGQQVTVTDVISDRLPYPPNATHQHAAWFDWACRQQAKRRQLQVNAANPDHPDQQWGGDDLDSMLKRAEHRIVAYSLHDIVPDPESHREIEAWLTELCQTAPLTPWVKLARYADQGKYSHMTEELTWGFTDDEIPGVSEYSRTEDGRYTRRFTPVTPFTDETCYPVTNVSFSGNQLLAYFSDYVYEKDDLNYCEPAEITDELHVVIGFQELPGALVMPRNSILHLRIDQDGQSFFFTTQPAGQALAEEVYQRRWGGGLDENKVFSEDDLAELAEWIEVRVEVQLALDRKARAEHDHHHGHAH